MNFKEIFCLVLVGVVQALEGSDELETPIVHLLSNDIRTSRTVSLNFQDPPDNININFKKSSQYEMQPELENLRYKVDPKPEAQTSFNQILTELNSNQKQAFSDLGEQLSKQLQATLLEQEDELKQAIEKSVQTPMPTSQTGFDEHFNWLSRSTYADCMEALTENQQKNGVYILNLKTAGLKPFGVYCKFDDGKPWTVIQRRQDGSVDFYRNWTEYQSGFGNLNGEYWLGLDRIHALTLNGQHELLLQMETYEGEKRTLGYGEFFVAGEGSSYRLKLGDYKEKSSLDDKLSHNNGKKFTTFDKDNDASSQNCAVNRVSAWWHGDCTYCNPNGPYKRGNDEKGIHCGHWHEPLKYIHMAIRPVTSTEDTEKEVTVFEDSDEVTTTSQVTSAEDTENDTTVLPSDVTEDSDEVTTTSPFIDLDDHDTSSTTKRPPIDDTEDSHEGSAMLHHETEDSEETLTFEEEY